jgi:hypothetical protein
MAEDAPEETLPARSTNGGVGWIPALGTRGFYRPLSDPSTDGRGRGQTTSDGPFDGGDDALGEAAGEGHRDISGAGCDRPADGKGGPPWITKSFRQPILKNVTAPLTTKTMMAVITTGKTNLALPSMRVSEPLR